MRYGPTRTCHFLSQLCVGLLILSGWPHLPAQKIFLKNDKWWLQITPCKPEAVLKCVQGIADFGWPLTDAPEKMSWALLTQSQAGHCPRQSSAQLLTGGTHGRNAGKRRAQTPHFTH